MNVDINKIKQEIIDNLKSDLVEDFDRNILELILKGLGSIEENKLTATQSLLEFGVLAKYGIRFGEENEK